MQAKRSRFRRLRSAAAIALIGGAVAAPSAAASDFIPGYTDFPNAVRLQQEPKFIPGYTDFPTALRVADGRGANGTSRAPTHRSIAGSVQATSSPFDWDTAGIGAGTGFGACLLLVATSVALRGRARPVRTH